MTTTDNSCELVAERIALGEPLGDQTDHAATCERCATLRATAHQLGTVRRDGDPGMGFAARMTVAAQHRIGVRRRRRVAAGFAGAVAASALAVFVMTRTPDIASPPAPVVKAPRDPEPTPVVDEAGNAEALRVLVQLSDVNRSSHLSARWGRIERPLKPYRSLVKGTNQ